MISGHRPALHQTRTFALLAVSCLVMFFAAFGMPIPELYAQDFAPAISTGNNSKADSNIAESNKAAEKFSTLLARIGDVTLQKLPIFIDLLNRGGKLSISTPISFYDAKLHRIFVAFKGSCKFTGHLLTKIDLEDRCFTNDGEFAWDFTVEHIKKTDDCITFDFEGDLVMFLDKFVLSLVHQATDIACGLTFDVASEQLVSFLKMFDLKIVAEAVSKTLTSFSQEALIVSADELTQNAVSADNQKLAALIRQGKQSGGMTEFLGLSILKAAFKGTVGFAGTTLGGIVGNALVPGAGAFAGAFLGSRISSAISSTIVYKLAIELPMESAIKQICKYGADLAKSPADQIAREKISSSESLIIKKLKREFDTDNFETLNKLLHRIDTLDSGNRPYMTSLVHQVKDLLAFKITENGDWYGAKKYNQLQVMCAGWGIKF
ncbi:MAG: hypothetical protein HQM09_14085 [Candidatus Riflebacteria bacterium]|nr:hypothetical protein [Candidatus Riflebacteria bacterium]